MDFKNDLFILAQIAETNLQLKQSQLDNSNNPNKSYIQGQINNVINRIHNFKKTLEIAVYTNETIPNFNEEIRNVENQIKEIKI